MLNTDKSGGTRYSEGKPGGWWYAPLYGLRLVAPVWQMGAEKYAPLDWQSGQSFSTLVDCSMRHMLEVCQRGVWAKDGESGHLHLAHAAWNILCLLTFMALGREDLDDCTKWQGVTAATKDQVQERNWSDVEDEASCCGSFYEGPDKQCADCPLHSHEIHSLRAAQNPAILHCQPNWR